MNCISSLALGETALYPRESPTGRSSDICSIPDPPAQATPTVLTLATSGLRSLSTVTTPWARALPAPHPIGSTTTVKWDTNPAGR